MAGRAASLTPYAATPREREPMDHANGQRLFGTGLAAAVLVAMLGIGTCSAAGMAKPPAVGEKARTFALKELGGGTVRLAQFTKVSPVVLVMLRGYPGYQCPICTIQFGDFLGKADEFKQAGATVLFVYPGPAEELSTRAAEFVKGKDYPDHFRILLDPDYTFTNRYGLRWKAEHETSYPSTFVINLKRKVTYARVSKTHGDRAKVEDVLRAVRQQ
ncbi:MAG: peroxiredoxin family protein [Candidatus Eisenbacteria bacterium]